MSVLTYKVNRMSRDIIADISTLGNQYKRWQHKENLMRIKHDGVELIITESTDTHVGYFIVSLKDKGGNIRDFKSLEMKIGDYPVNDKIYMFFKYIKELVEKDNKQTTIDKPTAPPNEQVNKNGETREKVY